MMAKFRPLSSVELLLHFFLPAPCYSAQAARFDLTGPKLEIHVTRDGKTLPIASVPNLQAGDQDLASSRPAADPVGALSAGGLLSARHHQSSARRMVHQDPDVEPEGARRGRERLRSGRGAAGSSVSGPGDGWRLQHAALGGARTSRHLCPRLAGPDRGGL